MKSFYFKVNHLMTLKFVHDTALTALIEAYFVVVHLFLTIDFKRVKKSKSCILNLRNQRQKETEKTNYFEINLII